VAIEEISDELAKKIAVAAVAVLLQNSNQEHVAGIATSVTPKTHEQLLSNSMNGLNNNQMSVNNDNQQHILHYNEDPHDNELESPHDNHPEISSTSLPHSSPVVLHDEINEPKSITVSQPTSVTASYNNELDNVLGQAENAIHTSSTSSYQPSSTIPRSPSDVPSATILPSTESLGNGKTTAVKERSGNPSINLTEKSNNNSNWPTSTNEVEGPVFTAELKKPKKILGLKQQIKNEGTNFSQSRVAEPVVEPVVEPAAGPVEKPTVKHVSAPITNSLSAIVAAHGTPSKKFPFKNPSLTLIEDPVRKLLRIHGRIQQTIYQIEQYINYMDSNTKQLQTLNRRTLDSYIDSLKGFLPEIINYEGATSKVHNIKLERINQIIVKAESIIEGVHKIIYSSGGKRRTHKKRKQKKQKKRFSTQKK
jgi:hypothetical protein